MVNKQVFGASKTNHIDCRWGRSGIISDIRAEPSWVWIYVWAYTNMGNDSRAKQDFPLCEEGWL